MDIDAVSPETASRVSTLPTSAVAHHRAGDERFRLESIYDERRAHLKIVILAGLMTSTYLLGLINAIIEEPEA